MKLRDIADMENYLENRCYCPHEIYDMTGFFFNCFAPDVECELLAEGERGEIHGTFVLAKPSLYNEDSLQIIYIEHKDGYVESCIRLDATENNKEQILQSPVCCICRNRIKLSRMYATSDMALFSLSTYSSLSAYVLNLRLDVNHSKS